MGLITGSIRRGLKLLFWALIGLLVVLPLLFATVFLGIQEASERQWLGKAPHHPAIDVRSREPHRMALLDNGFDSLAARMRLIESARESIELEFFIYEVDTASRLVSQALARKAQQGVKVRLLVDFARPVFKLAPHYAQALEAAGVQVRYYNTAGLARFFAANHRTHRKLLVVDRQQGIIGGRNIANEYFDLSDHYNFLDSDLLIDGPVVAGIADSFDLYWNSEWVMSPQSVVTSPVATTSAGLLSAPTPAEIQLDAEWRAHQPQHRWSTCNDTHFVTDYPGSGVERRKVYQELTQLAQEAQQQIAVESPYLVLREDGLAVLQQLSQRGVRLQVLTNSLYATDAFYTVASLAHSLDRLNIPQLEVWAYGGAPLAQGDRPAASARWGVHAKRAVFDDHTIVVGTYNLDPRSANLNSELMVVCRQNRELALSLRASLRARLAQARPVVGTPEAGGFEALVQDADSATLLKMRAVTPFANLLDFLM